MRAWLESAVIHGVGVAVLVWIAMNTHSVLREELGPAAIEVGVSATDGSTNARSGKNSAAAQVQNAVASKNTDTTSEAGQSISDAENSISAPETLENHASTLTTGAHSQINSQKSTGVTVEGSSGGFKNRQNVGAESYFSELRTLIQAQERYPADARRRRIEETIRIFFSLDNQGSIVEIREISGAKSPILVEAALTAVKRAAPFPPPPAGISHVFQIPIEFKIK